MYSSPFQLSRVKRLPKPRNKLTQITHVRLNGKLFLLAIVIALPWSFYKLLQRQSLCHATTQHDLEATASQTRPRRQVGGTPDYRHSGLLLENVAENPSHNLSLDFKISDSFPECL
jgi:hypothetical protein